MERKGVGVVGDGVGVADVEDAVEDDEDESDKLDVKPVCVFFVLMK